MSDEPNMIIVITGANLAIYLAIFLLKRWVPFNRTAEVGIYSMLLPLGFGECNVSSVNSDLPL